MKKLASTNAESAEQSFITKMPPVKLPGRQTNNSLSSITGNIVIPTLASNSQPPPPTPTTTIISNASSSTPRKKAPTKAEM